MGDAFQKLASFWRRAEFPGDDTIVADVLWLAKFLPAGASQPVGSPKLESKQQSRAATEEKLAVAPADPPRPSAESAPEKVGISTRGAGPAKPKTVAASQVTIAAAAALPNSLALSRALRPFSRRFPSRTRSEFDEELTAEATIRNLLQPTPCYRPLPERWFEVALVVEETPSMEIWRQTIREFRLLLERQGSFRDVRVWRLRAGGKLFCRGGARRSAAVGDTTGRRLVLLVSDCVSADWHNGVIGSLALQWGEHTPVAVIQVLPPGAWAHTAIGEPSSVLRSPRGGLAAAAWRVERGWWAPDAPSPSITVPVVPLDPAEVLSWARMLMAMGGVTYPGVVLSAIPSASFAGSEKESAESNPQVAVDSFRAMVSPEAFQLACYLAAAPLTLPVMRLVQQSMFRDHARQFHLAEFFLGGLIRKVEDGKEPDETTYEFLEGIQPILAESLQRADAFEVVRKVSKFIEERIGQPLDWKALTPDADGKERLPEAALPFARVAREILGPSLARRDGAGELPDEQAEENESPRPQPLGTVLMGHGGRVTSVVATMIDGVPVVVSAGDDGAIRVWDLASGALLRTMVGPRHPVLGLDQSGGGHDIYCGGEDGLIIVDARTGETVKHLFDATRGAVTAISAPTAWGYGSGVVDTFDFNARGRRRPLKTKSLHKTAVTSLIRVRARPELYLSTSEDATFAWSSENDDAVRFPHGGRAIAVAGENTATIGTADGLIRFWDVTKNAEARAPLRQEPVTCLTVLQNGGGNFAVSGSTDGQLRIWNLETGSLVGSPVQAHHGSINSLFTYALAGGAWIAISAGDDAKVRITDLRPFLSLRHSIMLWTLGDWGDLPGMILGALTDAGHTVHQWDRSARARDLLPSCDHTVVVIPGPLWPGTITSEAPIWCRPFFIVALGPGSQDLASLDPRATRIDFRNRQSYKQRLHDLVKTLETAAPVRVGGIQGLPMPLLRGLRRSGVQDGLKRMLLDPDGPSVIYIVNADPCESYDLARAMADDCDVRLAFSGGIYGAHTSLPALDLASERNRALLIVTAGSLMDGAVKSPIPNVRVLVADSSYRSGLASAFEIPAVSVEETASYLQEKGVTARLPSASAVSIAAFHGGSSRLLYLITEVALAALAGTFSPDALAFSPDLEDDLVGIALESLNESEKQAAIRFMALRDGDWAPMGLVFTIGAGQSVVLQRLGILEQNVIGDEARMHSSARRRLAPAPASAHSLVISHYMRDGTGPVQQVHWDGYFEKNIEHHLARAGLGPDAVRLLSDLSWLRRKLFGEGIRRLLSDLSNLYNLDELNRLNDALGASAGVLENGPNELPAALLRYPARSEEPLGQLQASAFSESSDSYRNPTYFVLATGSANIESNAVAFNAATQLGRELARGGLGLVTGGYTGVDEATASAYLAERSRLGLKSETALIQIAGDGSRAVKPEGSVIRPEGKDQEEAVRRADAVVLIEGLGGAMRAYLRARVHTKPVFPIAGTGGDAKRVFDEMAKSGAFFKDDIIGREMNAELTGPAVRAVIYRLFLLSRRAVRSIVPDPAIDALAQEYLDIRATQASSSIRTRYLTDLFSRLQIHAHRVPDEDIVRYLQSVDRGIRLAGMARALAVLDFSLIDSLVIALTEYEDTPFGQYWCLRAIMATMEVEVNRPVPPTAMSRLRRFAPRVQGVSDRGALLDSILADAGSRLNPTSHTSSSMFNPTNQRNKRYS